MDYSDPNAFTYPFQLTKALHRSVYPLVDPSKPENSAEGKNVIVTGASQGIGKSVAEAFCIAKANSVVIVSRNQSDLKKVAEELRTISSATKVIPHATDLKSEDSVKALYDKAASELGGGVINVLINNAGSLSGGVIGDISPSQWWTDFEVNVKGSYLMNHYFLKQLQAQAHGDKGAGAVVGTTIGLNSAAVAFSNPGMSSYCSSKIAQTKVTEFLQVEHPDILRSFSLLPGIVMTKMTLKEFVPYAKDEAMLSGALCVFLATKRADWLKGQTVSVNWDIEEMEAHKEEILNKQLIKLGWLGAKMGKEGHPWEEK